MEIGKFQKINNLKKKRCTWADLAWQVSGECWRMWLDGLGRAGTTNKVAGASDVVVDVVVVL